MGAWVGVGWVGWVYWVGVWVGVGWMGVWVGLVGVWVGMVGVGWGWWVLSGCWAGGWVFGWCVPVAGAHSSYTPCSDSSFTLTLTQ